MLGSVFNHGQNHYGPVILTAGILASIATAPETMDEILAFHQQLASDEYVRYVDDYYRQGRLRFGRHWRFMDISTVLYAAAKVLQPETYLEIGVRRGRSVSMVARACPSVNIAAFDMWVENYAGMENPGADFVRQELARQGHTGSVSFFNGDSHQTIPAFFQQYPDTIFDMITVDGDHSEGGAFADLCQVIPQLAVGGVLVFDDISHPVHPYLLGVWRKALAAFPFLEGYEFTDAGFGVAFAIRKW
jgi:predicted O-methyltransferase YrrM